MIVIGVDPDKQTHAAAAVDRRTGELLGELTVRGNEEGHTRLLEWPGSWPASVASRSRIAVRSRVGWSGF
jgi:hypothetical protein